MKKTSQTRKKKSAAQAMVEFALALPILLLVVYGLIETGRLIFIYASVVTAARQAARYGSATGDNGTGTKYYNDCSGITAAANSVAFIQAFTNISISYDGGPGTSSLGNCPFPSGSSHPENGDRILVSVSAQYSPIVPLLPFKPFTITSESNRTLLVGASIAVNSTPQGYNGGSPAGLVLGKIGSPDNYTYLGERITYYFTLQNTGNVPIEGPFRIDDDKIGTFYCTGVIDPLPANMSSAANCSPAYYYITMADLSSPEVTNHAAATAEGSAVVSNQAVYTVSFLPQPALTLAKSGTPPFTIAAGQQIQYDFVLTNTGNTPLSAPYSISDALIGSNWSCPSTPSPLSMNSSVTCTGTYALKNPDINNQTVTNTATASAFYNSQVVTSPSATATVQIPPLLLVLSANPTSVNAVGQVVTYTYTLTNQTTTSMSSITVTDTRGASGIACLASLAPGQTASCTHAYSVTQTDLNSPTSSFSNTATAAAGKKTGSNSATVSVAIANQAQRTLTKSIANLPKSGN